MDEEREALMEIIKANADLPERLEKEELDFAYDRAFDILVLTIGKPRESITEVLSDGLQLRLDPDTLAINAFEVLQFRNRFLKAHPNYAFDFDFLFGDKQPPREEGRRAARQLTPLLSV